MATSEQKASQYLLDIRQLSGFTWLSAHQQLTRDWWESRGPQFDLFVAEPVLEEAAAGDAILAKKRLELLAEIRVLALTGGILKLAESLVADGPIPPKAGGDALHIAIATAYACEYLLTLNCRHIANAEIQRAALLALRDGAVRRYGDPSSFCQVFVKPLSSDCSIDVGCFSPWRGRTRLGLRPSHSRGGCGWIPSWRPTCSPSRRRCRAWDRSAPPF